MIAVRPRDAGEPSPPEAAPPRVLIVDDRPEDREAHEAALSGAGADLVLARSGEEALELLRRHEFAAIVLDVRMPGLSGFETARLARGAGAWVPVPILLVSGSPPQAEELREAYVWGVVDFLTKPVQADVLRAKVGFFVELFRHAKAAETTRARYDTMSELAPVGLFHTDAGGDCLWVNPRWCEIAGLTASESRGKGWMQGIHPDDRARVVDEWYAAAREGRPFRLEYRFSGGRTHWVLGQAKPEVDGAGRTTGYVGTITDITDRKAAEEELARARRDLASRVELRTRELRRELLERARAEEALTAAQAQLRLVTDRVPALISYIDRELRYVYVNRTYQEWFGSPPESVRGRPVREVLGQAAFEQVRPHMEAALAGRAVEYESELRYDSGVRAVRAAYVPDRGPLGEVRGFVALVSDVSDQKAREERERFLSAASAELASSLEYEDTIRKVAELAILGIADGCAVDLLEDGNIRRLAVAHRDPAQAARVEELMRRYPLSREAPLGVPAVLRSGRAERYEEITDELLRAAARDDEHLELLRGLGVRSAMIVPIRSGAGTAGTLSLIWTRADRRYGPEDFAFAQELGRRAGLAVENARHYREARREIERRKALEAELLETEARYRRVLEGALDAVVSADESGRILDWNRQAEIVFGLAAKSALGRPMGELIVPPRFREAYRRSVERWLAVGDAPVAGRRIEIQALRADGAEFPVEISVIPVRAGGKSYFTVFIRDITERKSRERETRLLAEAGALFSEAFDPERLLRDLPRLLIPALADGVAVEMEWEKGKVRRTGRVQGGPAEADGEPAGEARVRRELGGRSSIHVALRARERPLGELRLLRGEERAPFSDDDRRVAQALADRAALALDNARLFRELQELTAQLEGRVEDRTAELRKAMREIEAFSYTIAHDLRAPVRTMTGFSEALLEDYAGRLEPPALDALKRIREGGKRMDVMIRDLLEYSRLVRGDVEVAETELGEAVDRALGALAGELAERRAKVEVDRPLPRVRAHPLTLPMVLQNLISNAAKFVAPGVEPRIRVRAEELRGRPRLWIEDNGIGIDPRYHERIFGVFERLHPADAYPGTGIGLAIVSKAMERIGGRVGLESAPGKGSRFYLEFPGAGREGP